MKEDDFTSTVDGAAGYERMRVASEPVNDDKPSRWELNDYKEENEEDEEEEDDDRCNCSDPGCPCGGNKRGGL